MIVLDTNVVSEAMRSDPNAVATWNVKHFVDTGVELINPWEALSVD